MEFKQSVVDKNFEQILGLENNAEYQELLNEPLVFTEIQTKKCDFIVKY